MDSPVIRFNLLTINPIKRIWLKGFSLLSGLEELKIMYGNTIYRYCEARSNLILALLNDLKSFISELQ